MEKEHWTHVELRRYLDKNVTSPVLLLILLIIDVLITHATYTNDYVCDIVDCTCETFIASNGIHFCIFDIFTFRRFSLDILLF